MNQHTFHGIVVDNCLRTSKDKGTPSVAIQVKVDKDVVTGEAVDRMLTGDIWLTDRAIDKSLETLKHVFGWVGDSLRELNQPVLVDTEVEVVTSEEIYNGKEQTRIAFFNKVGESSFGIKKAQSSEVDAVVSKFDAALRLFKQGKKDVTPRADRATAPARAADYKPAAVEDDLPF